MILFQARYKVDPLGLSIVGVLQVFSHIDYYICGLMYCFSITLTWGGFVQYVASYFARVGTAQLY